MKQSVRLLAVLAVLAIAPAVLPPYYVTLLNYIGISALVAIGLVLLTGVGGLTSFGQAALLCASFYRWMCDERIRYRLRFVSRPNPKQPLY